ncbi:MAG: HDIG domain-containing protein [Planctomycetes bacterium]|nr:HDIG domain-containing protein [Planctomycetota bacterium]
MWPFEKKSARRQEIRRSKAKRQVAWVRRWRERVRPWPFTIALGASIVAALILNAGGEILDLHVGEHAPRAIASRLDFEILDEQQTRLRKVQARDTAPNFYDLETSLLDDIQGKLTKVIEYARKYTNDPTTLKQKAREELKIELDDAGVQELQRLAALPDPTEYQRAVERAIQALAVQPLVQPEPDELAERRTPLKAVLRGSAEGAKPLRVDWDQVMFSTQVEAAARVADAAANAFRFQLRPSIRNSIIAMLRGDTPGTLKPIYGYNKELSTVAADEAYDDVPPQKLEYKIGDILADAGAITAKEIELLAAEHAEFQARQHAEDLAAKHGVIGLNGWEAPLGRTLLAFLIVFGLAGYMWRYHRKTFARQLRLVVTTAVLLLLLGAGRFCYVRFGTPQYAVGAQAFAAALLGIVFAQGSVFAVCGALAALLTIGTQQDVGFLLVLLAMSGVLIFGLRDVRNRGKIVAVGVIAGAVAWAVTIAALLIERQFISYAVAQALYAGTATLAAAFLMEGLLPGIERVFGLSTSMTLLEWRDSNKPLMRMMAAEAPGTYNHSLLVGTLAESAAEAIGANGLLAIVGAYYHDIGKINKPEYFVENQDTRFNRHERLSPAMSLLIIIGHVKDGIEMAKEYGLPPSLRPFIAEHHGTTLVEFFYHAASKARKPGDSEVADIQFRYPGPKPRSRETAILMLCDGVEGAVRAMAEPTPGRIEETVGSIVRKRLMDGQFDECDLTFRELETIEKSLIKSLCGIYHARIVYPSGREDEKEAV